MRAKTNTITINGRTYDAVTGRALQPKSDHTTPTIIAPSQPASPAHATKHGKQHRATHKITVTDHQTAAQKKSPRGEHIAVRVLRRQPERSHTLMRTVVKKPNTPKTTHGVAGLVAQPEHTVIHKGATKAPERRIATHTKSELISKFGPRSSVTKLTAHVPVAPAPQTSHHQTSAYDIGNVPPAPHLQSNRPLREVHRDLFESALQSSESHKSPKVTHHKRKGRKAARLTIAAASLLLLVGFFAYQNAPNLALKRASSTIGFSASMPGYHPSGFRQNGQVQYQPGRVIISFRSNSDERAYTITQSNAYNDEQSLRQNYLAGKEYETIQANQQVGYLFGDSNFTWVRNGVWYTIQGNAELSRDQLVKVATSLF